MAHITYIHNEKLEPLAGTDNEVIGTKPLN